MYFMCLSLRNVMALQAGARQGRVQVSNVGDAAASFTLSQAQLRTAAAVRTLASLPGYMLALPAASSNLRYPPPPPPPPGWHGGVLQHLHYERVALRNHPLRLHRSRLNVDKSSME